MKFSSAVTFTTVISIMSAAHGAPILPAQDSPDATPIHYRRHSSVSELSGREFHGHDIMESLNAAYEPGNGIKHIFNYVKRQLGGSAGGSTTSSSNSGIGSGTTPADVQETGQAQQDTRVTDGGSGLMGGGMSSTQEAGFAYEPGQGIGIKAV